MGHLIGEGGTARFFSSAIFTISLRTVVRQRNKPSFSVPIHELHLWCSLSPLSLNITSLGICRAFSLSLSKAGKLYSLFGMTTK